MIKHYRLFAGWKLLFGIGLFFVLLKTGLSKPVNLEVISPRDTTRSKVAYVKTRDTLFYAPVCGSNRKTYLNEESAHVEGIVEWSKGRCSDYSVGIRNHSDSFWIYSVEVNGMANVSGAEEKGFSNFTNVIFELSIHQKNFISLKGNDSTGLTWRVWIDFNKNTRFEKSELVLTSEADEKSEGFFDITPKIESDMLTRMRVWRGIPAGESMKSTGTIEDYTVQIAGLGQENIVNKKRSPEEKSQRDNINIFIKLFLPIKFKFII